VRAARLWPLKRLEALREQGRAKEGADVLGVEPARGGGRTGRTGIFTVEEGRTDEVQVCGGEQADGG